MKLKKRIGEKERERERGREREREKREGGERCSEKGREGVKRERERGGREMQIKVRGSKYASAHTVTKLLRGIN